MKKAPMKMAKKAPVATKPLIFELPALNPIILYLLNYKPIGSV